MTAVTLPSVGFLLLDSTYVSQIYCSQKTPRPNRNMSLDLPATVMPVLDAMLSIVSYTKISSEIHF